MTVEAYDHKVSALTEGRRYGITANLDVDHDHGGYALLLMVVDTKDPLANPIAMLAPEDAEGFVRWLATHAQDWRLCACGCGSSLRHLRADAVYATRACKLRHRERQLAGQASAAMQSGRRERWPRVWKSPRQQEDTP